LFILFFFWRMFLVKIFVSMEIIEYKVYKTISTENKRSFLQSKFKPLIFQH
jgi:hypothetical protein